MTVILLPPRRRQAVLCHATATYRHAVANCLQAIGHEGLHYDHPMDVAWAGHSTAAIPCEVIAYPRQIAQ